MTDEQIVIIVAETIERSMFAPHEFPLSVELHAKYLTTAREVIKALKFARPKLVDADSLATAMIALRDIAIGTGKASPPDALLVSRDTFREGYGPLLQRVARDAVEEIDRKGSGTPIITRDQLSPDTQRFLRNHED